MLGLAILSLLSYATLSSAYKRYRLARYKSGDYDTVYTKTWWGRCTVYRFPKVPVDQHLDKKLLDLVKGQLVDPVSESVFMERLNSFANVVTCLDRADALVATPLIPASASGTFYLLPGFSNKTVVLANSFYMSQTASWSYTDSL